MTKFYSNNNNNNHDNFNTQNDTIRTNYVKARIDNLQQISKCSKYSKLAQKEYKTQLGGQGDPLGIVQEI